jgi:hypothetical protein
MHLHYSPFQFATDVQASNDHVNVYKTAKTLAKLTTGDAKMKKNLDCTMSVSDAAMIMGSPNAFISPNPVGVMKDLKKPMAATGVYTTRVPKESKSYDNAHRTRGRVGYGDRMMKLDENIVKSGAGID